MMTKKNDCCSEEHQGHLCVLASREAFDEIKELIQEPRFICFNCGRAAHSAANLCNPMPLDTGSR